MAEKPQSVVLAKIDGSKLKEEIMRQIAELRETCTTYLYSVGVNSVDLKFNEDASIELTFELGGLPYWFSGTLVEVTKQVREFKPPKE